MKTPFWLIVNIQDICSVFQDEKLYKLPNYILPSMKKASSKGKAKADTDSPSGT